MTPFELIEDIRSGRNVRKAQKQLYTVVRDALLSRLGQKIPHSLKSRLDPEDVLHTAFLRALSGLPEFRGPNEHSFIAWVYRIAKNLIHDEGDRWTAGKVHFAQGEEDKGPRASQFPNFQASYTTDIRRREWIDWALGQLAPKEAEVIRLHDLQDRSYEEIAEAWESTPGAVQRFHSRAWQKLSSIAEREAK